MPTLYDALCMTDATYNKIPRFEISKSWELLLDSTHLYDSIFDRLGYRGQIYINRAEQEIVIAHRGTKVNQSKDGSLQGITGPISNLISDSQIFSVLMPHETKLAIGFVEHFLKNNKNYSHFSFTQVGHSLGGFQAHVLGYAYKHKVIAFDPPGAMEQIEKYYSPLAHKQFDKHYSFFLSSNLINRVNTHAGQVFHLMHYEPSKKSALSSHTLETHRLVNFFRYIPEDSLDPEHQIPPTFKRNNAINQNTEKKGSIMSNTQSAILENEIVSEESWVVYLLNSTKGQHAFILLEGVHDQEHHVYRFELLTPDREKGIINAFEFLDKLKEYAEDPSETKTLQYKHAFLDGNQARYLIDSVLQQKEAVDRKHETIKYITLGGQGGENCLTWAQKKIDNIPDIKWDRNYFADFYTTTIVAKPSKGVKGGRILTLGGNQAAAEQPSPEEGSSHYNSGITTFNSKPSSSKVSGINSTPDEVDDKSSCSPS